MDFGDSRTAVAVGLESHLVAAYSDELDCVARLRFRLTPVIYLEIGSGLLTVKTYYRRGPDPELYPGLGHKGGYRR
jgi:hypothetical protein